MSVDYRYPNGATLTFMCRQQPGKQEVSNLIVGTKGVARIMPFAESTITSHGGKTLLPRMSIGQHGFVAHFEDTEGNRVALHESPSES